MKYISTRGTAPVLDFESVLLAGLASDGGLYVPEQLPQFIPEQITKFAGLSYAGLAFEIMAPFVGGTIPDNTLRAIIDETYAGFRHSAVAPLIQIGSNEWVMELFHGPTLAFKDFALQLLGRLLDHCLTQRDEKAVILGATSGDTGSAAIEGCRHSDHVDLFILHPHNWVSEVQRRQMTTVLSDHIHNVAIKGNFDDCQAIVKASFAEQAFLKGKRRLVAVNSINWARIMAQVVYYFHATLSLGGATRAVSFAVPTGNFGDIFAGYIARGMGLPIQKLIAGTNQNNIIHRFFNANSYQKASLKRSLSPSMDIMVSSNFERLLFDLHDRDGKAVTNLIATFDQFGTITIDNARWQLAKTLFDSQCVSDDETVALIRQVFDQTGYLLDPHTAIAVKAARDCHTASDLPVITLATAHPVKFPDAILAAGLDVPMLPHHLLDLYDRKERMTILPNSLAAVQEWIASTLC
ncbi:MAG: threonine synthase [Endozoicomonadaceae bacterium]|nr:threonine synthase [Endozoicomonadaceae bacterium]